MSGNAILTALILIKVLPRSPTVLLESLILCHEFAD